METNHAESIFMPAYLKDAGCAGIKVATLYPENPKKNLPTIHSKILMLNVVTGEIEAMVDGEAITAIRTAAMAGLVTDLLAKKTAKSIAIIGAGVQARMQLDAVCSVRETEEIRIYSRTEFKSLQFRDDAREKYPRIKNISVYNTAKDAVKGVDIVCFSTSHLGKEPIIEVADVDESTHINSIGGASVEACEFPPELMKDSLLITDSKVTCATESGEIKLALQRGIINHSAIFDISDAIHGNIRHSKKRVIFKGVGYMFPDMILSKYLCDITKENNTGLEISYFGSTEK